VVETLLETAAPAGRAQLGWLGLLFNGDKEKENSLRGQLGSARDR